MDTNMKLRLQRAALLAIITGIFHADNDTPLRNIKLAAANSFSDMIDLGVMVGDEVDVIAARAISDYLDAERGVVAADEILNPSSN